MPTAYLLALASYTSHEYIIQKCFATSSHSIYKTHSTAVVVVIYTRHNIIEMPLCSFVSIAAMRKPSSLSDAKSNLNWNETISDGGPGNPNFWKNIPFNIRVSSISAKACRDTLL